MPDYPGLGYDLRAEWDRTVVDYYPVGLDSSCPGAESSLLLVREVAMMIVMDRLTDKPNFHIKVFDDAITSKWIEEGLAIPVDQLYDGIVRGKGVHSQLPQAVRESIPKPLKTILDRECMEYVRTQFCLDAVPALILRSVHPGTACQGRVLQAHRPRSHPGCFGLCRQIRCCCG